MKDALRAVQRGLEALYRVETGLDVGDFLLSEEQRSALCGEETARRPREQLLCMASEEGLDVALYVDEEALRTLACHDPRERVSERNLRELMLVLEGVSHFIYLVHRARQGRPVSQLELELQAEVDKYVTLVLHLGHAEEGAGVDLADRLYGGVAYDPALTQEERARYRTANDAAARYARRLSGRHRRRARWNVADLLGEVRRFWRLGCADKLSHIEL